MPVNFRRYGFRVCMSMLLGAASFVFALLPGGKAAAAQNKQQVALPTKPPVAPGIGGA